MPIYFVTNVDGFMVNDIRVGLRSQFIQSGDVPSEAFRVNITTVPELVFRPGESLDSLRVDIVERDLEGLPEACSAFRWDLCLPGMDLAIVVTNVADTPRPFSSWVLGSRKNVVLSA
jgi:hypothetical protein